MKRLTIVLALIIAAFAINAQQMNHSRMKGATKFQNSVKYQALNKVMRELSSAT